ncbi:polysaccharide deacetylase family protein [Alteromonas sp. CYL-A6]|uniref:polysaccharide deacetylase family protein n=1 Tax=Alteromonas nitratireducens TaxID=3390813 RepID=UPI0034BE4BAB
MLRKLINTVRNAILGTTLLEFTGHPGDRALYLTFDDGPSPGITDKLLDLFQQQGVKATFFVIGTKVDRYPELTKRIIDDGHTIGNHSYSHPNFDTLPKAAQFAEIDKASKAIATHTGVSSNLFRVPRGRWPLSLLIRLKARKVRCIHWTTDSMDYTDTDPDSITRRVVNSGLKPGQVLLFHDDASLCLDVMERLIPQLKAMNFSLKAMESTK